MVPWEHGSEYHLVVQERSGALRADPWNGSGKLYGSGRDALRALLKHGSHELRWRRLWVPTYFCQEVLAALTGCGVQLLAYPDGPCSEPDTTCIAGEPSDAILTVAYFGMDTEPRLRGGAVGEATIIEDHTHDPWSAWAASSSADWCIASLRKSLPLPDGAALWSPAGHALPQEPRLTSEHARLVACRIAAMGLKAAYLGGAEVPKPLFLDLYRRAEASVASGAPSAISSQGRSGVADAPVHEWRATRRANYASLRAALPDDSRLRLFEPASPDQPTPFSAVMLAQSGELRECLRHRLIENSVYPAVLWRLDKPVCANFEEADCTAVQRDFAERMLSLHCDMRYGEGDMHRVAAVLRRVLDAP